ncbi:MAG: FixJ family two-component response regulator [Paraglaciecola sp.]|jgi:FixJ family two-component response regulator
MSLEIDIRKQTTDIQISNLKFGSLTRREIKVFGRVAEGQVNKASAVASRY